MAKRFVDTDIWSRSDIIDCSPNKKLLFMYVITSCSSIGIFTNSLKLTSFILGFEVTEKDLLTIPVDIEKLKDGKYWMPRFCDFQYGELKETCKPHKRYMADLKKEGLFERVCKGYIKGIGTLEEKEEEKEEEEEQEKPKAIEDKSLPKPPESLQAVLDHCYLTLKKYKFDAWGFHEWYESTNWFTEKGKPVRNWKGKLNTAIGFDNRMNDLKDSRLGQMQDYVNSIGNREIAKETMLGMKNAIR